MHNCVHPGFLLEINFVFCACICPSFYAIIGLSCNCFCVVYTLCKPHYVTIQDTYSSLDLSWWTECLSRGLLSSKIGSSLCLAKLPKLQSFRKQPFCNGGCNTLSKIIFYLVFHSSLLLRFHMPAFLQSACLLSADYSIELCSHRPTFHVSHLPEHFLPWISVYTTCSIRKLLNQSF